MWQEQVLTAILRVAAVLGAVAYAAAIGSLLSRGQWMVAAVITFGYLWLLVITLIRRLPYRIRAGSAVMLLYIVGLAVIIDNGLAGSGRIFLFAFVCISGLLLGLQAGLAAALASAATLAAVGMLMTANYLPLPPLSEMLNSIRLSSWLIASSSFLLLGSIVVIPLASLLRGLENTLVKEQELSAELEKQRDQLEIEVLERTHDLQQRMLQIRAASEYAQIVIHSSDLDQLLQQTVEVVTRRFEFSQTEVLLTEMIGRSPNSSQPVVRKYVTSGPTQRYLGETLPIEPGEIPGWVIAAAKPVVKQSAAENPDSQAGDSQAGVPILAGKEVLGALVVQAEDSNIFSVGILEELETLASQLAVAVQKFQLQAASRVDLENTHKRLKSLETLDAISHAISIETDLNALYRVIHEQITRVMGEVSMMIAYHHSDSEMIEIPYAYENGKFLQIDPFPLGQGLTSVLIRSGQPLLLGEDVAQKAVELGALTLGEAAKSWLGVPLLVAGNPIGALIIQDSEREGRFSEEDQSLLVNLASQIAIVVRNTRLLEEARQRAERERTINRINSNIRRTVEMPSILKTTAGELTRALGAKRVRIEIQHPDSQENPDDRA